MADDLTTLRVPADRAPVLERLSRYPTTFLEAALRALLRLEAFEGPQPASEALLERLLREELARGVD